MHPFPSINQFRNVVAHVRRKASFMGLDDAGETILNPAPTFPTLSFVGTVKLHGTNAAVVFSPEGVIFQSRERVLTAEQDNAGFYAQMSQHTEPSGILEDLYLTIVDAVPGLAKDVIHTIAVYGEWCGGNIQKGVAISGLPKMFVIFAVKVNGQWLDDVPEGLGEPSASIYSIYQFPKWFMTIDFEKPEAKQNLLGELTQAVEDECPVGKHFGNTGVGEGIVWRCVEDPSPDLWFKVKGEKHSTSKVKTLAAVDTEAVESIREFVTQVVTEARLEQGLQNLTQEQRLPVEMPSLGNFIRWVHADVMKEEADTMAANEIDPKKLGGPIAQVAKRWYINRLDQELKAS